MPAGWVACIRWQSAIQFWRRQMKYAGGVSGATYIRREASNDGAFLASARTTAGFVGWDEPANCANRLSGLKLAVCGVAYGILVKRYLSDGFPEISVPGGYGLNVGESKLLVAS